MEIIIFNKMKFIQLFKRIKSLKEVSSITTQVLKNLPIYRTYIDASYFSKDIKNEKSFKLIFI
jgi:hypothetical protein